jgi:hypothetical protein
MSDTQRIYAIMQNTKVSLLTPNIEYQPNTIADYCQTLVWVYRLFFTEGQRASGSRGKALSGPNEVSSKGIVLAFTTILPSGYYFT